MTKWILFILASYLNCSFCIDNVDNSAKITSSNDNTFKKKVKDIDGNQYNIIRIGNQFWSSTNLRVKRFRNGDTLFFASNHDEWTKAGNEKQPAWCYPNNDPSLDSLYGVLYNGYAVLDPRGLAPKGYHIPYDSEWDSLISFLGGDTIAGIKLKENFIPGSNSGFLAHLCGSRSICGCYNHSGRNSFFWSIGKNPGEIYIYELSSGNNCFYKNIAHLSYGFSVRFTPN